MVLYFFFSFIICMLILMVFYFVGKFEKSDFFSCSGFECGFTSYFFSRFSFSVHFFLIALIFLFFDLELSFIFFFFLTVLSTPFLVFLLFYFILVLFIGLILEWLEFNLDWIY